MEQTFRLGNCKKDMSGAVLRVTKAGNEALCQLACGAELGCERYQYHLQSSFCTLMAPSSENDLECGLILGSANKKPGTQYACIVCLKGFSFEKKRAGFMTIFCNF